MTLNRVRMNKNQINLKENLKKRIPIACVFSSKAARQNPLLTEPDDRVLTSTAPSKGTNSPVNPEGSRRPKLVIPLSKINFFSPRIAA